MTTNYKGMLLQERVNNNLFVRNYHVAFTAKLPAPYPIYWRHLQRAFAAWERPFPKSASQGYFVNVVWLFLSTYFNLLMRKLINFKAPTSRVIITVLKHTDGKEKKQGRCMRRGARLYEICKFATTAVIRRLVYEMSELRAWFQIKYT